MNNSIITKETLLQITYDFVIRDSLDQLSIRRVAKECHISVGCVYNYFPSKAELVYALIEKFWHEIFHKTFLLCQEYTSFISFLDSMYLQLYHGLHGFNAHFLQQISVLSYKERVKGKEIEATYWNHMKNELWKSLECDKTVPLSVWNDDFTKAKLIDFVFSNIMLSLRNGNETCNFLLEILSRILYK